MKTGFMLQSGNFEADELHSFLQQVDALFPIYLSSKTGLSELAEKYIHFGTCIGVRNSHPELVALIAGYNNDSNSYKAYISLLAVLPEYQGKGIASRLITAFEERCRENGMVKIEVFTHRTNSTAIRLYERNGYTVAMGDESRLEDFKYIKEL